MTTRRNFTLLSITSGLAAATGAGLAQAAAPVLTETDAQAKALGYVTDAKRADKARFSKYKPGEHCGGCQLFQGKPADKMAPCAIFGGKQVDNPGWCSAYVARPA